MICLVNHEDKKVIVAYRGTKPSHLSDMAHNAAIVLNQVVVGSEIAN